MDEQKILLLGQELVSIVLAEFKACNVRSIEDIYRDERTKNNQLVGLVDPRYGPLRKQKVIFTEFRFKPNKKFLNSLWDHLYEINGVYLAFIDRDKFLFPEVKIGKPKTYSVRVDSSQVFIPIYER